MLMAEKCCCGTSLKIHLYTQTQNITKSKLLYKKTGINIKMYSSLISLIRTDARMRWQRCVSLFLLYVFTFLLRQVVRTPQSASIRQAVSQIGPNENQRWQLWGIMVSCIPGRLLPFTFSSLKTFYTHLQILHKGCVCRKLERTH